MIKVFENNVPRFTFVCSIYNWPISKKNIGQAKCCHCRIKKTCSTRYIYQVIKSKNLLMNWDQLLINQDGMVYNATFNNIFSYASFIGGNRRINQNEHSLQLCNFHKEDIFTSDWWQNTIKWSVRVITFNATFNNIQLWPSWEVYIHNQGRI